MKSWTHLTLKKKIDVPLSLYKYIFLESLAASFHGRSDTPNSGKNEQV